MKDTHFGLCCCLHILEIVILMFTHEKMYSTICRALQDSWEPFGFPQCTVANNQIIHHFLFCFSTIVIVNCHLKPILAKLTFRGWHSFHFKITPLYHYHQIYKRKISKRFVSGVYFTKYATCIWMCARQWMMEWMNESLVC